MQYPYYSLTANKENTIYKFTSIGKTLVIKKIIIFATMNSETNLYNLSFGDEQKKTNNSSVIDDKIISNNGDMNRVLATVFRAILDFTKDEGFYKIVFRGSTPSRTRLYRMAISINYDELSKYFVIYGLTSNGDFVFFKKHTEYLGFLITPIDENLKF